MSTFCLGWNFGSDTRVSTLGLAKRSSNRDTENESISSTSKLKMWPLLQHIFLLWEILLIYTHSWRGNPESCGLAVRLPFIHLTRPETRPVLFSTHGIKLVKFLIFVHLLANFCLIFTFTSYLDSLWHYPYLPREPINRLAHFSQLPKGCIGILHF